MAKQKNNKMMIGICAIIAVAIIAVIVGVVIVKNNQKTTESTDNNSSDNNTSETSSDESDSAVVSASDLVDINTVITYGDYDGMSALSKDIQNNRATGKVVKITGLVSHPGFSYSVVQPNADGTAKIGTNFVIQGVDEADYPKDGEKIEITGKVVEKEPLVYIIQTLPEYIGVVSE